MGSSRSNFNALAMKLGLVPSAVTKAPSNGSGKITPEPKRNKYNAKKVTIDGIEFDSIKEGEQYKEFKYLKASGGIKDFEIKKRWVFVINGVKVTSYRCDFYTHNNDDTFTVYDVKGGKATITEAYTIRKKLLKSLFGLEIKEI